VERALWITWYGLPAEGRDAYLTWLHGKFIRKILRRPGVLWAAHYAALPQPLPAGGKPRLRHTDDPAVPTGNGYILIFGGKTAHAFCNLVPHKLLPELPAEDRKMLALRIGERVNIVTGEDHAAGPSAKKREGKMALAPCIQLGSFNAGTATDDEVLDWYANLRLPAMSKLTGCLGSASTCRLRAGRSTSCCTSSNRSPRATSISRSTTRTIPKWRRGPTRWCASSSMRRARPTWRPACGLP